jgi:hypothetical protein
MAVVLAMPGDHDQAGRWLAGEQAARTVAQVFLAAEDDPRHEALRRARRAAVLALLDARIDPRETRYTGMAPRRGCALFTVLGAEPGLERLAGYVESLWDGPPEAEDLEMRLDWLQAARTDAVKLLVLYSIQQRPPELPDAGLARAESLLVPLEAVPHLAASATAALALLRGCITPEAQRAQAARRWPTTRLGLWWHVVKLRCRAWFARPGRR